MAEVVQLQKVQTPRALFRQPLALQWYQDGELVKRKENERQAGKWTCIIHAYFDQIVTSRLMQEDLSFS